MSFYELDRPVPTPAFADRIGAFFAPVRNAAKSMMYSFTYARMMHVMYDMDEATLARIGITRAQIPAYVEKCLANEV